MGNNPSAATQEENEAAGKAAMDIFKMLDVNADEAISKEEWEKAFESLDDDANGVISRKEWFIHQSDTVMYDAIYKASSAQITREEWLAAFDMLDTNKDGEISLAEWMSRRRVRLGLAPIGMTLNDWGVGVGDEGDFYEVISGGWRTSEMLVTGPKGIVAVGKFAEEEGAREKWVEAFKAQVDEGTKPGSQWNAQEGEPRSRALEDWKDMEEAGWTMRTDEDIDTWIKEWVVKHPEKISVDAIGRECNDQTFAIEFIGWLTGTEYSRMTDNAKGRTVVYGGLALLATAGGLYLANRMSKSKSNKAAKDDEAK